MLIPIMWKKLSKEQQKNCLQRPLKGKSAEFVEQVQALITQVRLQGDAACLSMTKQFDGVELESLIVQPEEFEVARSKVSDTTRRAILRVIEQLEAFHVPQKLKDLKVETSKGVICEALPRAIQAVGLYAPGGSAPLVSTVLMLAVPARIANCPKCILCTPPNRQGQIDPAILVAAELAGIQAVYKIGGAQAIAAMAYGTESIPKVDKIFGPGNAWVMQAKLLVAQDAEGALYDLPAGPSEVMVIADAKANPNYVAADLLSQAEHGADSQVILLCTDVPMAQQVSQALEQQIARISRRSIAEQALKNSALLLVNTVPEALAIANDYAPEHLILQVEDPRRYLKQIQNAGSVFLGPWSPESAGDYASGSNHVLPTNGYARSASALSVRDFMKTMTVQELTREGLADLSETIAVLAGIEGLEAHQNAVTLRLEETKI